MNAILRPIESRQGTDYLTPQQRRRLNFIRLERLSASEAMEIAADFDPGLEYEQGFFPSPGGSHAVE